MLSYMLPVEEKCQTSRNLSLNLNLQNTTQPQISGSDQLALEDTIDENTKLLTIEPEGYLPENFNGHGNMLVSKGKKINYNINITNNNMCDNLINPKHNISHSVINHEIIVKGHANSETDSATISENTMNNNEETNSNSDKKIIKMTKLGTKNVTLKR